MSAIALLRDQIQQAHGFLETVMEDVTPEQAGWQPPGTANSISATYAHAILGEDAAIHMLLQGIAPLYATEWAHKSGISEIQPLSTPEWARRVQLDLALTRRYAQAVHASVYKYLETLQDADLSRGVDLTSLGLGQSTVGTILNRFVLGHADNLCGEISCLKGLQGLRGYPF